MPMVLKSLRCLCAAVLLGTARAAGEDAAAEVPAALAQAGEKFGKLLNGLREEYMGVNVVGGVTNPSNAATFDKLLLQVAEEHQQVLEQLRATNDKLAKATALAVPAHGPDSEVAKAGSGFDVEGEKLLFLAPPQPRALQQVMMTADNLPPVPDPSPTQGPAAVEPEVRSGFPDTKTAVQGYQLCRNPNLDSRGCCSAVTSKCCNAQQENDPNVKFQMCFDEDTFQLTVTDTFNGGTRTFSLALAKIVRPPRGSTASAVYRAQINGPAPCIGEEDFVAREFNR